MLLDLDEFLTAPDHSWPRGKWWERPSLSLSVALRLFSQRGADVIRVHWRVYGANSIDDNPTCATLPTFRRPSNHDCPSHRIFKTLFRARPGLTARRAAAQRSRAPFEDSAHTFAADGENISACVLSRAASSGTSRCSLSGMPPPLAGFEALVLRHYVTRSRGEWARKVAFAKRARRCSAVAVADEVANASRRSALSAATCDEGVRYSRAWANRTFEFLNQPWKSPALAHHAPYFNRCRMDPHRWNSLNKQTSWPRKLPLLGAESELFDSLGNLNTSSLLGPSAALPPRVTVGGSGRAGLSHAEVGLVLVASVMQIELCYVKEWVEYHLDHGGPRSTLYLLPQRGAPTIAATAVPDAGQERFMREFSVVDHPRVHVLCNVSGMPGGCASPQAVPYLHRTSHQELMLRHLVPKRECAAPASSIPHVRHAPSMRRL